jgi:hypothetical protein
MNLKSLFIMPMAIWINAVSPAPAANETKFAEEKDAGQWKMVRNTEGVKTFHRYVTQQDGGSYGERKGELIINCSLQEAVRLVSDAESTRKWMSGIDENYKLTHINLNEWYNYTKFSIPWPFSKRDLVSLYKLIADPAHGLVTINITCKDTYVPLKPGIIRLTDYHATWAIKKQGEKTTSICFIMSSSQPPAFPRYIQEPIIERMFHNNLVRLRDILMATK